MLLTWEENWKSFLWKN